MPNSKFPILIIGILALVAATGVLVFLHQRYATIIVDIPKFNHRLTSVTPPQPSPSRGGSKSPTAYQLPPTLLLSVPFTPQAPTGNWDQLHNEACEEANTIMAVQYFALTPPLPLGEGRGEGSKTLDPQLVESGIAKLTQWQDQNFGYHLDTTSAETARMMEQVYGLKTKLIGNFTADQIKNELAQNHLVIISEYGRALGNPFYKQPGPIHHMLLIKGYDAAGNFITNDSGTKRGLDYLYDFNTIYAAAADWSHETNTVDQNKKIAIVVWR